jgi:hypothetical protein
VAFTVRDYNNLKPLLYDPAKAARYRKQLLDVGGDVAAFDADLEASANYGLNKVEAAKYKLEYGTLHAAPERKAEMMKGVEEVKAQTEPGMKVTRTVQEEIPQKAPGAPPPQTVEKQVETFKPVSEIVKGDIQNVSNRWKEAINWDKFISDPSLDILDVGRAIGETFQQAPGRKALLDAYKNEPAKRLEAEKAYDAEYKRQQEAAKNALGKNEIERAQKVFALKREANQAAARIQAGKGTPEDERRLAEWNASSDEAMGLASSLGMWGLLAATTVAGAKQAAAPFKWNKALAEAKGGQIRNMMEMSGYKATTETDVKTGKPTTVWTSPNGQEKIYETPGGGFRHVESGEVITPKPEAATAVPRALPGRIQPETPKVSRPPVTPVTPPPTPAVQVTPQDRQALLNDFFYLKTMPYTQVIERIGEQGFKSMVQAGVFMREGSNVALTPNGHNLAKQASRAFQGFPTTRAGIAKREEQVVQTQLDKETEARIGEKELLADNRTRNQKAQELIDKMGARTTQPPAVETPVKEPWQMTWKELENYTYNKVIDFPQFATPAKNPRGLFVDGQYYWAKDYPQSRPGAEPRHDDIIPFLPPEVQLSIKQGNAIRVDYVVPTKKGGYKGPVYLLAKEDHKILVAKALAEGKPVPPEVLAEYPDLQKQTRAPEEVVKTSEIPARVPTETPSVSKPEIIPFTGKLAAAPEIIKPAKVKQAVTWFQEQVGGNVPQKINDAVDAAIAAKGVTIPPALRIQLQDKAMYLVHDYAYRHSSKAKGMKFPEQHLYEAAKQVVDREWAKDVEPWLARKKGKAEAAARREGIQTPLLAKVRAEGGLPPMLEKSTGMPVEWEEYVTSTPPQARPAPWNRANESNMWEKGQEGKTPARRFWAKAGTQTVPEEVANAAGYETVDELRQALAAEQARGRAATAPSPQPSPVEEEVRVPVQLLDVLESESLVDVFAYIPPELEGKFDPQAEGQVIDRAIVEFRKAFGDPANAAWLEGEGFDEKIRMNVLNASPKINLQIVGDAKLAGQGQFAGNQIQVSWLPYTLGVSQPGQMSADNIAVLLHEFGHAAGADEKFDQSTAAIAAKIHLDQGNTMNPEAVNSQVNFFKDRAANAPTEVERAKAQANLAYLGEASIVTPKQPQQKGVTMSAEKQPWEMTRVEYGDSRLNMPFVKQIEKKLANHEEGYVGTVGDVYSPTIASLFPQILDVPIYIRESPPVNADNPNYQIGAAVATDEQKRPFIEVYANNVQPVQFAQMITNELAHLIRFRKGRSFNKETLTKQTLEQHGQLPYEQSAERFAEYIGSLPEPYPFEKMIEEAVRKGEPVPIDILKSFGGTTWADQEIIRRGGIPEQYNSNIRKLVDDEQVYLVPYEKIKENFLINLFGGRIAHKQAIKLALFEGKPVPPEVLAEYPDLKPAEGPAPPGQPQFNVRGTPEWLQNGPEYLQTSSMKKLLPSGAIWNSELSADPEDFTNFWDQYILWCQDTGNPPQYVEIDLDGLGASNEALTFDVATERVIMPVLNKLRELFPYVYVKGGDEFRLIPLRIPTAGMLANLEELDKFVRAIDAGGVQLGVTAVWGNHWKPVGDAFAGLKPKGKTGGRGVLHFMPDLQKPLDAGENLSTIIQGGKSHAFNFGLNRYSGTNQRAQGESSTGDLRTEAVGPVYPERPVQLRPGTPDVVEGGTELRETAGASTEPVTPVTPVTPPVTPAAQPPTTEKIDEAIVRFQAYLESGTEQERNHLNARVQDFRSEGDEAPLAIYHAISEMEGTQARRQVTVSDLPYIEASLDAEERKKFLAVRAELYDAGVPMEQAYNEALRQVADIEIVETPQTSKLKKEGAVRTTVGKVVKPKPTPKPDELAKLQKYNATKVERTYTKPSGDAARQMIGEYTLPDGFRLTGWGNGDWSVSGKPAGLQSRHPTLDLALAAVGDRRAYLAKREQLVTRAEEWKTPRREGEPVAFGKDRAFRFARYLSGKKLISDLTMEDIDRTLEFMAFIPPEIGDITHLAAWTGGLEMVKTNVEIPEMMALAESWNLTQGEESAREVGMKLLDHIRANAQNPWLMPPKEMSTEEYVARIQQGTLQEPTFAGEQVGMERILVPAPRILNSIGAGHLFYKALSAGADLIHWMDEAMTDFRTMIRDLIKAVGRKPAKEFIKRGKAFDILNGQATTAGLDAPYVKFVDSIKALIERVQAKVDEVRALEGLPPLEKLPNYIYHQFEQVIQDMLRQKYPFDESMAYLLQKRVIPVTNVRDVTQLHRIGREGGLVKDLERLIPALTQSKLKYAALQPVVTEIRQTLKDKTHLIPAANRAFIETWLENGVLGSRKSKLDQDLAAWAGKATHVADFIAKVFEKIPGFRAEAPRIRANFPKWITDFITKGNYAAGLGFNIQTSVLNLFQQIHNIGINGPAGFLSGLTSLFDHWAVKMNQDFNPSYAGRKPAEIYQETPYGADLWGTIYKVSTIPYAKADEWNIISAASGAVRQLLPRYPELHARVKAKMGQKMTYWKAVYESMAEDREAFKELWARASHRVGVSQYFYNQLAQAQISHNFIGRLAWVYKTWMQNYFLNFIPEMVQTFTTGKDSMGNPVSRGERYGLLWYLLAAAAINYAFKKAKIDISRAFGLKVFSRQPSPILNMLDKLGAFVEATQGDSEYRKMEASRELQNSLKIFIPFRQFGRILDVITGKEPRWWTILTKDVRPLPKPEQLKRFDNLNPERAQGFLQTLDEQKQQAFLKYMNDILKGENGKWSRAERIEAGNLGIALEEYLIETEKQAKRDAVERMRAGDLPGAALVLQRAGYRGADLKAELDAMVMRYMNRAMRESTETGRVLNLLTSPEFEEAREVDPTGLLDLMGSVVSFADKMSSIKSPKGQNLQMRPSELGSSAAPGQGPQLSPDAQNLLPLVSDPARAASLRAKLEAQGGNVQEFDKDLEEARNYQLKSQGGS